jgi:hypothetical protein
MAVDAGGPAVGGEQRGEDPDGGGLAGPVAAEQSEDGSRRDAEVDALQHRGLTVGLRQTDDLDGVCRCHGTSVQP